MDQAVSRFDFAPITRSKLTDEGYLQVWARAARTGTQVYTKPDGSRTREYRPPEEVSSPESLATFGMKPVTWTHPPERVDSANSSMYRKGFSGSNVRYTDGFVEVALVVEDQETVQKIQANEATQVSAGYTVDYDPTPGVDPQGQPYDGVQRNIKVNHIAIVPKGRAGPEVRLLLDHMDAADAVAIEQFTPDNPRYTSVMAILKLDGLDIELPAEAAGAVSGYVKAVQNDLKVATDRADTLQTELETLQEKLDTLTEEKEAAEGRADAYADELDSAEPRIDTAELDRLVLARLNTLQKLAPAFAEDFKFDGIDDEALYSAAFESLTGNEVPEDADPAYITGVVDGILAARSDAEPDEEDEEGEGEDEVKADAEDEHVLKFRETILAQRTRADAQTGASAYKQKLTSAWTKPLTATK